MARTDRLESGPETLPASEHPVLRLLGLAALVEVLWGLGLLAILGIVSVTISVLLSAIGGRL